jgi:virginiamycin B lyase
MPRILSAAPHSWRDAPPSSAYAGRVRRWLVPALLVAVVGAGCGSGDDAPSRPTNATADRAAATPRLVERLRRGGYVLALRHAATDQSMADTTRDLRDCSKQRNLSAAGRRQAQAIGRALRRLRIPVGTVLTSPYCRTRDTARLAFGRLRTSTALLAPEFLDDRAARERQPARTQRLLASRPARGTNTVVVTHGFAISAAADVTVGEGETAIFAPGHGRRGFQRVDTVTADEWTRLAASAPAPRVRLREYRLFAGAGPHDVAPARDGTVWFTAQAAGELGRLDPRTGRARRIPLGSGSAPHGVIVGPDRAAWVTDGGLNAIVRVEDRSLRVRRYPHPSDRGAANLNTATFDRRGILWFTGQGGIYGRLDPRSSEMRVFDAPRGPGPYGIATTPSGDVWYASLAGSYIARLDADGAAHVVEPPTEGQGARRVWPDSRGRLWVSEWNAGKVAVYDPRADRWQEWRLPGDNPMPYAVFVDEADVVWLTDFGASALVRFDPEAERFARFPLRAGADVRQLLGRRGELWGAESGADRLVVARTG